MTNSTKKEAEKIFMTFLNIINPTWGIILSKEVKYKVIACSKAHIKRIKELQNKDEVAQTWWDEVEKELQTIDK